MSNSETVPYIYVGQANLYNKIEAGAELATFVNKVLSNYVHKEGTYTGLVEKGRVFGDENYRERLSRIGIRLNEEGRVISQPTIEDRADFKASNRGGGAPRRKGAVPSGSTISSCTQTGIFGNLLGHAHRKRKRTYNSQRIGEVGPMPRSKASIKPEGFLFAIQEFAYYNKRIPKE